MGVAAADRWAAARALFEEFGAGTALLAALGGLEEPTIARRAQREGWRQADRPDEDPAAALRRAIAAAVHELEAVSASSGQGMPNLDRGRIETVLAMLKTVEKLGEMTGVDPRPEETQTRSDADIAAALRRIDERIVELALAAAGRMGGTNDTP
jgi:hypothetical protein